MFQRIKARLWQIAGNSRTIAVAYAIELLSILDEAQIIDWSALFGYEKAGRITAVLGIVIIGLRLITRNPVNFRAPKAEDAQ